MESGSGWDDSSLGDVRPYTVTGGRTRAKHPLRLTTCLMTRPAAHQPAWPSPEGEALLLHCSGAPCSVAELAARISQPVQVVKVLIGDLLDCDALVLANPMPSYDADPELLRKLLDGLQRL